MKIFNTIIQLRRDNDYNFEPIKDKFIPANGEVILIDTAKDGLRAKVGNGLQTFAQLPFADEDIRNTVLHGYLIDDSFYKDQEKHTLIPPMTNKIYINDFNYKLYIYNGLDYVSFSGDFSTATDTEAGIVKLYNTTGQKTDGTMTQKAITDELELRYKATVDKANELLEFSL